MARLFLLLLLCVCVAAVPVSQSNATSDGEEGEEAHAFLYKYQFQDSVPLPPVNSTDKLISIPWDGEGDRQQSICVDPTIQVPGGLFHRFVCHVGRDNIGRRRRKPSKDCAFASIGIRGTEAFKGMIDNVESVTGMSVGNIDNLVHNVMHQGIIYSDSEGVYDYTSGYYCGQPSNMGGYFWYGWVCQDPPVHVNDYVPISNSTIALDNWWPRQYNLVDRKFDCDLMWTAEQIVGFRYDSCAHPKTVHSYRLVHRNCHSYVDDVVAAYDSLEEERNGGGATQE